MERRPRRIKKASDINKNLAKTTQERKVKLANAFPEARIPEWRKQQKLTQNE